MGGLDCGDSSKLVDGMRNKLLKQIWGLAKQQGLTKDDVYSIVFRETRKEHMSDCSDKELERVRKVIIFIKDVNAQRPNMATKRQMWKIEQLEKDLGWDNNPKRLRNFVKKYYHVDKLEWLKFSQASNLIDSLKNVLKKETEKRAENGR